MGSFKKELIHTFQALPKVEGLERNKLIVITATGMFIGNPIFKDNEEDTEAIKIMFSFINGVAEDYRKEHNIPADQPLDGNDGCIALSDVSLITGGSRYNIPTVAIFFDQIIGISWGDIN